MQHTDSHAVAHPPRGDLSPLQPPHRPTASARARAQPGATSDARRTVAAIRNPIGYPRRRDPAPVWYKRSRTDRLRYGTGDTPPRSPGRCGCVRGLPRYSPGVGADTMVWHRFTIGDARLYDHAGRGYPGITARDPDAQHGALPPQSSSEPPSVAHLCRPEPFSRALVPPLKRKFWVEARTVGTASYAHKKVATRVELAPFCTQGRPLGPTIAWPLRPTYTAKSRPSTLAAVAVTTGTPWWTTGMAPAGTATAVPITTCCCATPPPRNNRRLAASSSCCVR